jgi:hypothetical protein
MIPTLVNVFITRTARAAAVNINIDYEVKKPPACTLSEGRGG